VIRYGYPYSSKICTHLLCESFLYVERRLMVKKKNDQMLGNNWRSCLIKFKYELNGVETDRNRNVGVTIKNYVSIRQNFDCTECWMKLWIRHEEWILLFLHIAQHTVELLWRLQTRCQRSPRIDFDMSNDYILLDGKSCDGSWDWIIQSTDAHISLNELNKLLMLRALESDRYLSMSFRSWDLNEYPLLKNTTKHS